MSTLNGTKIYPLLIFTLTHIHTKFIISNQQFFQFLRGQTDTEIDTRTRGKQLPVPLGIVGTRKKKAFQTVSLIDRFHAQSFVTVHDRRWM